jgi:hypothetical protein
VFAEETLDEIGDRLEYSRGKFLMRHAKETGSSKAPEWIPQKVLVLNTYKKASA